jgi:predicted kinase
MGRVGTGKSTTASRLAELLGWDWASSDRVRKRLHGVPLFDRASKTTPEVYSQEATDEVYNELALRALANAKSERSTVIDATYGSRERRQQLRTMLTSAGLPFVFVEMTADRGLIEERLREREYRSDVISDARLEDLANLERRFQDVDATEWRMIRVSAEESADRSVTELLKRLSAMLFEFPSGGL